MQRSLTAYYDRFKGVLSPSNAHNIQSLLHIAAALHSCLQQGQQQQGQQQPAGAPTTPPSSSSSGSSRVTTVNDLLFDLGLDTINMFELAAWVRDNKMAFKVRKKVSGVGGHITVVPANLFVRLWCRLSLLGSVFEAMSSSAQTPCNWDEQLAPPSSSLSPLAAMCACVAAGAVSCRCRATPLQQLPRRAAA